MAQARLVGVRPPDSLRAILLEIIEDDERPVDLMARILEVAPPSVRGEDARLWVRDAVRKLTDLQVFDATEAVLAGGYRWDERITAALRRADVAIECVDGRFFDIDSAASEFDLDSVEDEATSLLSGKYSHVSGQWAAALDAMRVRQPEGALANAVNAMEGAVRTASGKKSLDDGLLVIFPGGERAALRKAIKSLYDYGSAIPNARHGGDRRSNLDRIEARGAVRAAAVWIVTVINLERAGLD